MNIKNLTSFDYILARNPIDMEEGGDVHDNSTRLKYLATARRMRQPAEPTPLNKSAMTAHVGIMFGGIPFFPHQTAQIYDHSFYSGLLLIDDQPNAKQASAFSTSASPKDSTDY